MKKNTSYLAILTAFTLASWNTALSALPEIYPTPQKIVDKQGSLKSAQFKLAPEEADKVALNLLKKSLPVATEGISIKIGEKDDPSVKGWEKFLPEGQTLPDKEGAYLLVTSPDEIILVGNDGTGTFYAVQTLLQLVEKKGNQYEIPETVIVDWPDVDFRGTVEGFYGLPWSHENRISQLKFYGKNKLNAYIYGPKNDPFHGFSKRWREFYPEDQAKNIAELAKVAQENKVHFIWALHPGQDIKWGEADEQAALKKFEAMYDLGVRAFGVFFDDIGGEGAKAEGQVKFLNFINKNFIHKKPDVAPLIMCPTQYNKSWSDPKPGTYLDILGDQLDKDIAIMWTGDTVVHDISKQGLEWVTNRIKRPAYIWWNFPVSDYIRHCLMIGRTYGLESETESLMSGFTSNPMDKPEASKIPLFGVADFTWNQKAYDSDKSWKAGIKRLFPNCAEEIQTLANHNSDPGPNGHGYRREESVEIAPAIEAVVLAAQEGKSVKDLPEFNALKEEFVKIKKAPKVIQEKAGNPAFLEEVTPWLIIFEQLGDIGLATLKSTMLNEGKEFSKEGLFAFIDTQNLMKKQEKSSSELSAAINKKTGDHYQKSIKSGTHVLMKNLEKLQDLTNKSLYNKFGGKEATPPVAYLSPGSNKNPEFMFDSDPNTYFYCEQNQKVGDYYGIDLGTDQAIKNVQILMGRKDGDRDAVHKGQLEYSSDAQTWKNLLPEETEGHSVTYIGDGSVKARYIRYRSTQAGFKDNPNVWTAFRTFAVNKKLPVFASTNIPAIKHIQAEQLNNSYEIKPFFEVLAVKPKEFLALNIPDAPMIKDIQINLNTSTLDWATLEFTSNGSEWEKLSLTKQGDQFKAEVNKPIKAIRFTNTSNSAQEITLNQFKLVCDPSASNQSLAALEDKNLATGYTLRKGQPLSIDLPDSPAKKVTIIAQGEPLAVSLKEPSGKTIPLGKLNEKGATSLNLKSSKATELIIQAPSKEPPETEVYELIWD